MQVPKLRFFFVSNLQYLFIVICWGGVVYSVSDRNEYQESSWGKGRPARKADNYTAIYRPIV
jgi:hypothetical protein